MLKRPAYITAQTSWEDALDDIATKTAISVATPTAHEGASAFREERPPKFE